MEILDLLRTPTAETGGIGAVVLILIQLIKTQVEFKTGLRIVLLSMVLGVAVSLATFIGGAETVPTWWGFARSAAQGIVAGLTAVGGHQIFAQAQISAELRHDTLCR